jgi:hypothetical protein
MHKKDKNNMSKIRITYNDFNVASKPVLIIISLPYLTIREGEKGPYNSSQLLEIAIVVYLLFISIILTFPISRNRH